MIILEELQRVKSHPTAVEVFEMVRRRLPRISLGTVYRNLERLAAAGTIRKLVIAGTEARFDGDLEPHYHVRCTNCGQVADVHGLSGKVFGEEIGEITEAQGYEIFGHRLEFLGICPRCKAAAEGGGGRIAGDARE